MLKICFLADVDECETDETICDENAYCINTNGSYDCVCFAGYEGNGTTCKGIKCMVLCPYNFHDCLSFCLKVQNVVVMNSINF